MPFVHLSLVKGFIKQPLYCNRLNNSIFKLFNRHYALTGNTKVDTALETVTGGRISRWIAKYENFVGLTEVMAAQHNVIEAENQFLQTQIERREKQHQLSEIQMKLKHISAELDKHKRGDDQYLALVTEENKIIKEEDHLSMFLEEYEQRERNHFSALSSAVRESHEKERARADRTKYWSIIGSVIGATVGIMGTSLNNYLRMKELRSIVKESAEGGIELKYLASRLSETMTSQHNQIQSFVVDLKTLVGTGAVQNRQPEKIKSTLSVNSTGEEFKEQTNLIVNLLKKQEEQTEKDLDDIKRLLAISKASDTEGNVIYVGPEFKEILKDTEKNLEWKIKMNSLWTVTFIYGAFALTLPLLVSFFKGGS